MPVKLNNQKGATLIEVLLAACLTIGIVVTLSLAFPIATKSILQSRQTLEATHLANSQMVSIKSQPYSMVDAISCDCTAAGVDFTLFVTSTSQNAGTNFKVASCVNYVAPGPGNTWNAQCPADGDTGYKVAVVKVFWSNGSEGHAITQESSLTRF